jgi:hypothetical protein
MSPLTRELTQVEEVPKKVRDVILATHYAARKEALHADSAVRPPQPHHTELP